MLVFKPRFLLLLTLLAVLGGHGVTDQEDRILSAGMGARAEVPGQKEDDEGEPSTEEPIRDGEVKEDKKEEDWVPGEVEVEVEVEEGNEEVPRRRVQRVERGLGMGIKEEERGEEEQALEEGQQEEEVEWREGMLKKPKIGTLPSV